MYRNRNPPNRFDPREIAWDEPPPPSDLEIIEDNSRSILVYNDVFGWSCNPYRGCTHACAYCYAREYHETLGYGAGIDFERKIVVKRDAPALLMAAFDKPSWGGDLVTFSGATDCYQPLERSLALTRRCLEVAATYRNPIALITRSPLLLRDLDLLHKLATYDAIAVTVSIPILDRQTQRRIEPGAPAPAARLSAIRSLADASIPVGVSVSPILPGISEHEVPAILQQAREAGAGWAWADFVNLPGNVEQVYTERLRDALGEVRAETALAKTARMRKIPGKDPDPTRLAVEGLIAMSKRSLGFGPMWRPPTPSPFRRPTAQLTLFG